MQITNEWPKKKKACRDGYEFAQTLLDRELKTICAGLLTNNHYSWANWVLVRCMNKPQRVRYAIFAAREVLHIFEKKYPDDNRPRKAIEATEAYLKDPSADAAYAADAADARKNLQSKIVQYGVGLLEVKG